MRKDTVATLPSKMHRKEDDPNQGVFDLVVDRKTEKQGIGMGVLRDGTPFLNQRGLARLCGVQNRHIGDIGSEWNSEPSSHRIEKIKSLLLKRGIELDRPYLDLSDQQGGLHAYPDTVCLAILEYYAFEAGANCRQAAHDNFRLLAGHALREFIYKEVGYDPAHAKIEFWRQFHDRVSLTYDATPTGYFSVFKEISHIIVTIGQAGAKIDDKFVPDVSVGQHWARYWDENSLDKKYGVSRRYHHTYPNYFPQAASNPQPARCYPESALGEFRAWLRENYIGGGKLQNYLKDQVKQKKISPSFAQLAVSACSKKGGKEITTEKR